MVDYGAVAVRAVQTTLTYLAVYGTRYTHARMQACKHARCCPGRPPLQVLTIGAFLSVRPKGDPMIDASTSKKLGVLVMKVTPFLPFGQLY